jgi:hypothetical protein
LNQISNHLRFLHNIGPETVSPFSSICQTQSIRAHSTSGHVTMHALLKVHAAFRLDWLCSLSSVWFFSFHERADWVKTRALLLSLKIFHNLFLWQKRVVINKVYDCKPIRECQVCFFVWLGGFCGGPWCIFYNCWLVLTWTFAGMEEAFYRVFK